MKKNLLLLALIAIHAGLYAQSVRTSLFEEFTGETCGPCAATNPGLNNILLDVNCANKVIALKWQVDIPVAPTNTWSLYQTDKTEIRWRAYSYGYGINSAPSGRIDGQSQTVYGAASDHPTYITDAIINTAQSYTSPFSISMTRDWNIGSTAVNLTVNIQATANFTANGNLIFRTVMVERVINFPVQPGTNGEKDFYDAAIKSFPAIAAGIPMASGWTSGQTKTFTLSCPIPSYTRKKSEVALVGFIQDDGNRKVQQAARADKATVPTNSFAILGTTVSNVTCNNQITPVISVRNDGPNAVTALTVIPYNDGIAGTPFTWTGNLLSGASQNITLNNLTTATSNGAHVFSFDVLLGNGNYNLTVGANTASYFVASNYQTQPVAEGFTSTAFPPANWGILNTDGGPNWSVFYGVGAYGSSGDQCAKYDFYNNTVIGDQDEFYLPPMNMNGANTPVLSFDMCYCQRISGNNDKLEFKASSDCGNTWQTLYSNSGSNMNTFGVLKAFQFAPGPNDTTGWRTITVPLTGFNNKPSVLCKFVTTSDNGNNLFIDNVNLSMVTGLGKNILNNSTLTIFPNPANNLALIRFNSINPSTIKIAVFNALGASVYLKETKTENGINEFRLDTKDFASGIYSVMVESNGITSIKKLNIVK